MIKISYSEDGLVEAATQEVLEELGEFLANIVRLYRGEELETNNGSETLIKENFPKEKYIDVLGLCKVATLDEIEGHGWSLNPGRYVGVAEEKEDGFDFKEWLEELNEELEVLNAESLELEEKIADNLNQLIS